MTHKFFTETELALRWGISKRTLQTWRQTGQGPEFLKLGRRAIRYGESAVIAFEAKTQSNNSIYDIEHLQR